MEGKKEFSLGLCLRPTVSQGDKKQTREADASSPRDTWAPGDPPFGVVLILANSAAQLTKQAVTTSFSSPNANPFAQTLAPANPVLCRGVPGRPWESLNLKRGGRREGEGESEGAGRHQPPAWTT